MTAALPRTDAPAARTRHRIWVELLLYPGHTLPTAAAPVLVAAGLAVHERVLAVGPVLAALAASWLIHVGGVFTDNLVLITRHAHVPEHPELLSALDTGDLRIRDLTLATIGWFVASFAFAPYLAGIVGWPLVIALGLLGTITAVGYSAGPLPYSRLGLADPVFFVMFSIVAVPAAYAVQAAAHAQSALGIVALWRLIPDDALIAGLPIGALITNVLLIDEIRDVDFDRLKGWRTGAVRHGRDFTRAEITILTGFAYAVPVWLWMAHGFGFLVLLPVVTLPSAIGVAVQAARRHRIEDLAPMTPRAARLALLYALLLGAGLALS